METEEMRTDITCLRPLFCQVGPLSRCDGSAQLNQGGTTIICGVYGPAEVRPHKEMLEKATGDQRREIERAKREMEDQAKKVEEAVESLKDVVNAPGNILSAACGAGETAISTIATGGEAAVNWIEGAGETAVDVAADIVLV